MHQLKYADIPCWYEMTWDEDTCAIILKIEKNVLAKKFISGDKNYLVESFQQKFKFGEFLYDLEKEFFGFEKSFKRIEDEGAYTRFAIEIPVIRAIGKEKCPRCKGSGKNPHIKEYKCSECGGCKKTITHEMKKCHAIAATMNIAFGYLWVMKEITEIPPAEEHQLMVFLTSLDYGFGSCGICGTCSKTLTQWLAQSAANQKIDMGCVENAMIKANGKMGYGDIEGRTSFRAYIRDNGRFSISCPGNRCDIYVAAGAEKTTDGWGLEDHNVDNAYQQLLLLVGLAKLCTMARAAGVK